MQDEGKYLDSTNMDSYFQTFRIRGMDTSSKAYFATNCMMMTSPSGGSMQHCCALFSANQTTGVIAKENVTVMHSNSAVPHDYSTYTKTADEWTGRYSYHGNIPHSGQSHTYSYHQCFLYNSSGGKSSNHQNHSYYPAGNDQTHNSYVAPNERRLGGGVRHFLASYDGSSKGCPLEFYYNYHSSALNAAKTGSQPYSTSATSTTYQVTMFHQWDSSNEPRYDAFMSQKEGLYAHIRSSDSWTNLGAAYGMSDQWWSFTLSNGNMLLGVGGDAYLVNTSGTVTAVPKVNTVVPFSLVRYNWAHFCWNVGEDEWLLAMPGGSFTKFKIDPSTGYSTISNLLEVTSMKFASFDSQFHYKRGFWSSFSTSSVNTGSYAATFGTENSNGVGYGKSKLFYVGGVSTPRAIFMATYDIADLVSTLTYA
jgi:hypothetical protein